jgi:SH3-like domain-containing protein
MQKGAPVEIIAEYELWRKIEDWQGSQSWVHKSMLSGARTAKVISSGENNLYAKPDDKSKIIARIEDEVIGEVERCPDKSDFCLLNFSGFKGWILRSHLFGVYPKEVIN